MLMAAARGESGAIQFGHARERVRLRGRQSPHRSQRPDRFRSRSQWSGWRDTTPAMRVVSAYLRKYAPAAWAHGDAAMDTLARTHNRRAEGPPTPLHAALR